MDQISADIIRKKYQYRRLILKGEVSLPLKAAAKLIGSDCAYHLYCHLGGEKTKSRK